MVILGSALPAKASGPEAGFSVKKVVAGHGALQQRAAVAEELENACEQAKDLVWHGTEASRSCKL